MKRIGSLLLLCAALLLPAIVYAGDAPVRGHCPCGDCAHCKCHHCAKAKT